MARPQETSGKKDREKKKVQKRKDKEQRKEERKANAKEGQKFEDMLAYVDENGNISSTPPDPLRKKAVIKTEDIVTGSRNNEAHAAPTVRKGTVTFFNTSKGFGFIKDESGQSVFVHANALSVPIKENDTVMFETVQDQRGLSAIRVKLMR